jgi:hypothetical protein
LGIHSDSATQEADYPLYVEKHFINIVSPTDSTLLILDRTIVDTLSYMKVNGNVSSQWVGAIETIAKYLVTQITTYFFIPIEFEIPHDGIRYVDPEYQRRVESAIKENLDTLRPDYRVLQGSRTRRLEAALKWLGFAPKKSK